MRPMPSGCLTVLALLACLASTACTRRAAPDATNTLPPPENRVELRIGVLRHAAPMSYIDAHGQMVGFAVDLARNVVQKITNGKGKAVFVPLEPEERIPALHAGKVDALFANLAITPERAAQVAFSEPYIVCRLGVLSPAGQRISVFVQLTGKRLAVTMQSAAETYFQKTGISLLRTATNGEAFAALRSGRAGAVAQNNLTLAAWAAANAGYVLGIPAIGEQERMASAVRRTDTALATAINKALAAIEAEGFFLTAYNRHMPGYARLGLMPEMLFPVLGAWP